MSSLLSVVSIMSYTGTHQVYLHYDGNIKWRTYTRMYSLLFDMTFENGENYVWFCKVDYQKITLTYGSSHHTEVKFMNDHEKMKDELNTEKAMAYHTHVHSIFMSTTKKMVFCG